MDMTVSMTTENFNRMLQKVAELSKRLDALESRDGAAEGKTGKAF